MSFDDDDIDALVDKLISLGLIDVVGIDSVSGEFLYQVSPALNEMYPQIREMMGQDFLSQVNSLWVKGFVSMDITSESPMVSLNDDAFDQDKVASLTVEERNALYLIIGAMKQK
jgi:hypothetical protein